MNRGRVTLSLAALCLLLAGLASLEKQRQQRATDRYPAPGQVVEVDGRRLQLDCRGSGEPLVLLESGGRDIHGSLGWAPVHDEIAAFTRVCSYSRAGYLWSDSRSQVLEAEDAARDLRAALSLLGELPPFLPVGYSRGAFNALIFTDLFNTEVEAVLLVEPRHPELEARRARAGVNQGSESSLLLAKLGRALRWTGLARAFDSYCEAPWYSQETVHACKAYFPHSLDGIVSEDSVLTALGARATESRDLGDRPLLVLTRQLKDAWLSGDAGIRDEVEKSEQLWRELHAEMASWSSQGRQQIVADSSHQLPYTHPWAVVDGVRQLMNCGAGPDCRPAAHGGGGRGAPTASTPPAAPRYRAALP